MNKAFFLIMALSFLPIIQPSFASSDPPISSCYNRPDPTLCGFVSSPFSAPLDYFDQLMPGFATLLLWGPIVFGLWYKTQQPLIAGFAGILLVGTITGIHPQGVAVGMILLGMSLGIAFIDIFRRIKTVA